MLKRLMVICCTAVCIILTSCSSKLSHKDPPPAIKFNASDKALTSFSGEYEPSQPPEGMQFVAQKGFVAMFVDTTTGHFAVEDMRNKKMYYSVPADVDSDSIAVGVNWSVLRSEILVTDVNEEEISTRIQNSYDGCLDSRNENSFVKVKIVDNGVVVGYRFGEEQYDIAVSYTLCEDGFRATVLTENIEEKGDRKVYGISLLPNFGAAKNDNNGFILLPDGSGAIMKFGSSKNTYSAFYSPLYGNTYITSYDYVSSRQEDCLLPVIGIQKDSGGVLAIADNGDAFAAVNATAAGQSSEYNRAYFSFELRRQQEALIGNTYAFNTKTVTVFEKGPINTGRISVRYCLLDSTAEDGLAKMADVTREYIKSVTDSDVSAGTTSPLYISTLGGFKTRKSVMGFLADVTEVTNSFGDSLKMVDELKRIGISDFSLIYKGYDSNVINGDIGDSIHIDKAVGKKSTLLQISEKLGSGKLLLSVNNVIFENKSGGFSSQKAGIKDISLNRFAIKPYTKHTFLEDKSLSRKYLTTPSLASRLLIKINDSLKKDYPNAVILLSDYGKTLYSDFKTMNGFNRMQTRILATQTIKSLSGESPVAAETASLYSAIYSSILVNTPGHSSGFDMVDEDVPFYQMVMSGIKQVVSKPINAYGNPRDEFLNCIKSGMIPHYELIYGNYSALKESRLDSFYAADFNNWKDTLLENYSKYIELYNKANGKTITGYKSVAKGIYLTEYENGIYTLVNKTSEKYSYNGFEVPPMDFVVMQKQV